MLKELGKHLLFVHDSRVFNFVRHSEGRKSLKIWLPSTFSKLFRALWTGLLHRKERAETKRTEEEKDENLGSLPLLKTAIFWHQKSV